MTEFVKVDQDIIYHIKALEQDIKKNDELAAKCEQHAEVKKYHKVRIDHRDMLRSLKGKSEGEELHPNVANGLKTARDKICRGIEIMELALEMFNSRR